MKTLLSLNRIGAGCLGCLLLFALTARAQDSTTRGKTPPATSTASPQKGGDVKPGIAGTPIQGTPIGLEGDPGSVIVMANPSKEGSSVFYKGHKGTVRIVKGAATIEWEGGFVTRVVSPSEAAAKGKLRFEVVGSQLRKIPLPNSGNVEVPRTISDTPIGLEGDPGSVIVMATPPKQGTKISYNSYLGTVTLVERVRSINWEGGFVTRIVDQAESAGKGKLRFEVVGSQLRKIPLPNSGNIEIPGTIQGTEVGLEGDPGSVIVMANPPKAGSVILYKKYRGIVALLRSASTINWDGGFVTRIVGTSQQSGETRISDQGTSGGLISYRTAPPKKGSDGILTYDLLKLPDSERPTPK